MHGWLAGWVLAWTGVSAAGEVALCPEALAKGWRGADDDRVFYRGDFVYEPVPDAIFSEVEGLFGTLRARGTEVVVVPVPARAHAEAAHVRTQPGDTWSAARDDANYRALTEGFARAATVVDVLEIARGLPDSFSYRRDFHWAVPGAAATARAVAEAIRGHPASAALPPAAFEVYEPDQPLWDTATFSRIVADLCGISLDPEIARVVDARRTEALGVLDEAPPPEIVVVGSSFATPERGFSPHLMQALGTDVLTVYVNGGAALGALVSYLRSDEFVQHPPRFLVWVSSVNAFGAPALGDPLAFRGPLAYRQVVPSASGECTDAQAALTGRADVVPGGSIPILDNAAGAPITGRTHYLALRVTDPALDTFEVVTEHAGGVRDTYAFVHHARIPSNGRFYLGFRADIAAPVARVSLHFPAGATGAVSARVCPTIDPAPPRPARSRP